MSETRYQLRYLPLFYEDLLEKVSYIRDILHNPQEASDLIEDMETAILERQPVAEAFEPFRAARERRYPYYRIYVRNYVVYYVVIDDDGPDKIMEVRRFLYNKQEREQLL